MGIGDFANTQLGSTVIGGLILAAVLGLWGLLTKRGRHWIDAAKQWVEGKWVRLRTFVEDQWKRRQRTPPSTEHPQHADPPVELESAPKPTRTPAPRRPIRIPALSERELKLLTAQHRNASRVRLEIVREHDLPMSSWALKNWGPGDAYALYVTPKTSNFKLDQELWDELPAKEQVPLFWRYPHIEIYRTGSPQIRVEYTDNQDMEHVVFIDVPAEAVY